MTSSGRVSGRSIPEPCSMCCRIPMISPRQRRHRRLFKWSWAEVSHFPDLYHNYSLTLESQVCCLFRVSSCSTVTFRTDLDHKSLQAKSTESRYAATLFDHDTNFI